MEKRRVHREVVSFVRRSPRMTSSQRLALQRHGERFLVPVKHREIETSVHPEAAVDWAREFGREAELIVEIGSGQGDSLVPMAAGRPDSNVVAFEVFESGIASTVMRIVRDSVANVRIVPHDGAQGLQILFDDASVSEIWTFFADPWHKTKHHKRRLISRAFGDIVAAKLRPGGVWRLATDWEDYALWMREELDDHPLLENVHGGWAPRLSERPVTKYEQRGIDQGRQVFDLTYRRKP